MAGPKGVVGASLLAFMLGAVAALALPPLYVVPALLAFAGLLLLLRRFPSPAMGFALCWAFAFGWFLAGLYWIAIAFFTDAERFGALAVPAVVLLAAGLALLPGLAGLVMALVRWSSLEAQALALALAWTAAELARGPAGLRFPWNPVALPWTASDASIQAVAWLGQWGLGALTVAAFALQAAWAGGRGRGSALAALAVLVLVVGAGAARLALAPGVPDGEVRLRLVQASIAQTLKWDPERREEWFLRHLRLTANGDADLVIWPETAVPYQLEADANARLAVASVAPVSGFVVTGGNRYALDREPPVASNSLFAIGPDGAVAARYDKVELVPFGEFLPFRSVLAGIGLGKLTAGTLDFVPGPGPAVIRLAGLPPFQPLICYEAIFPLPAPPGDARPAWFLNVTNDAWFGRSSGPFQHLAMARLRAVEAGVPLVRAANNGISAVIDPYGRVVARLGLDVVGVLDARLPGALAAPPPVARWGAAITVVIALALAASSALVELAARKRSHGTRG